MMNTRLSKGLGALQTFIGLGAIGGGLGLILDPSGQGLGLPLDLLRDTPFSSYLIPGIILLAVNGIGSLIGAAASFTRRHHAGALAIALGVFLVLWLAAQVYWFGGVHWLHAFYFSLGLLECALGWSVRSVMEPRAV